MRRRGSAPLPESLEEIIRAFVRTRVENHREDPRLLRVIFEQAPRSQELLDKISRNERLFVDYTRKLLDTHSEAGAADTRTAARLVVTTVELVVHSLIAAPDPIDVESFEDELVTMFTRYLRADPPA